MPNTCTTQSTATERPNWWASSVLESGESLPDFLAGEHHQREEQDYKEFQKLHHLLLKHGGSETCFPVLEEDMAKILERGYYRKGTSLLMKGEPCHCHSTVANLWLANKDTKDVTICTGYALSKDGMWRQHSWLLQRYQTTHHHRTRVVETTAKRVAYFGYELTVEEAEEFCDNNLY